MKTLEARESRYANNYFLQILTLSLAEQTNRVMRLIEGRILPDKLAEKA